VADYRNQSIFSMFDNAQTDSQLQHKMLLSDAITDKRLIASMVA
jgi:hypothetical protein